MAKLVDINTKNPDRIKYSIKLLKGEKMILTEEFLKARNMPDIGYIPISPENCIKESKNIAQ